MKLFFFVLFLSLKVEASDCISQAANLSLGLKLQGAIGHELYGEDGAKDSSGDVCKSSMFKDEWSDSKNAKVKMLKIIKNDFKTKGKTSSEFLYDLDDSPGKKEMTDAEICPLVDKQIKKDSNCPSEESSLKSVSRINFISMDFEEACRSILPKVKENFKNRADCSEEEAKKDDVVKREPPGEEIAPADENERPVVKVVKPKSRSEVREEQPARINSKSSSGVTRQ